mgnify:CR=1
MKKDINNNVFLLMKAHEDFCYRSTLIHQHFNKMHHMMWFNPKDEDRASISIRDFIYLDNFTPMNYPQYFYHRTFKD